MESEPRKVVFIWYSKDRSVIAESKTGKDMDCDFPPLPLAQSDLAKLTEMFPSVERPVVQMVLEGAEGGFEGAMEVLLGMAGPHNESNGSTSQSTPAPLESSSFAKAASTILGVATLPVSDRCILVSTCIPRFPAKTIKASGVPFLLLLNFLSLYSVLDFIYLFIFIFIKSPFASRSRHCRRLQSFGGSQGITRKV